MEGSGEEGGERRVHSGHGAARRQIPVAAAVVAGHGACVAGQGAAVACVASAAGVAAQDQSVVGSQGTALAGVSGLGVARAPAAKAFGGGAFPAAWRAVAGDDHWRASSGSCESSCSDGEEEEDEDDSEPEEVTSRRERSGPSIGDVMQLVKQCGATYGTNEHFIATIIFTKRAQREMFLTMDAPEVRFRWLKKKYEWMTRNHVAK